MDNQEKIQQITSEITRNLKDNPLSLLYLLVDAAQFPDIWKVLESRYRSLRWLSLFENTKNNDAVRAGPVLIQIDVEHVEALNWLLEHASNAHYLSWIISPLPHAALRDHLSELTNVETEDGSSWVMRYFDTRIFPVWHNVLTEEQKHSTLGPVSAWGYYDRRSAYQAIRGAGQSTASLPQNLKLTQAQENILFDAAYPDAIIQKLEESGTEELLALEKVERYDFIARQIHAANKRFGIDAVPDTLLYCTLALIKGEEFEKLPPYADMLRQVRESGDTFGDIYDRFQRA